ncbi:uncharacterized protein LOC122506744 [Leptopilina heterotoma]|uniref:uncharacterized protein LOC122506744 n=1 Tax=Leptopilina heterotoma TaxID=63436 RepID=UPI001CA8608F|nr:uncharacterized protein LOC122506744 [Leptopilina heterotoma]
MNNETLLSQSVQNFQFLSVCHYITSFGIFFNNQDLIPLEYQNHSVSVLNTLFDYLYNSTNEASTKLELLQKVLAGSDLYGGGENETLDMIYVDDTFQYIISNALFSHYGNIHGYLAGVINRADNVKYSVLKKNVFQDFLKNYRSLDYCSSRRESIELTSTTVRNVFNNYIWSIFPEPPEDMDILDVNYIYAIIGLKIAESIQAAGNLSFDNYILLSQAIELQTMDNESYQLTLELFKAPALFYYAHIERTIFRHAEVSTLIKSKKFWYEAYNILFRYINLLVSSSLRVEIKRSLYSKLQIQLQHLMSQTFIAAEILRIFCHYSSIAAVSEIYVSLYKFSRWILKIFLPKECSVDSLPDLEELYDQQFDEVRKTFNEIEQNSLKQVLVDGDIIKRMNLNSTVINAKVPHYDMYCMYCPPMPRKTNSDIYLIFAIIENKKTDFYALRQENNTLTLLRSDGNKREFSKAVANDSSLEMEIPVISEIYKRNGEDYKIFVQKIADIKTEQFIQGLKKHYRDPTDMELVIDFLKSLVPFYTCIQNIKSGNQGAAAISCTFDVLSLFPFAGVGAKYFSVMWSSMIAKIGPQALSSISKSVFTKLIMSTGLNQIFTTLTKEMLTKQLLKDITVASLRTLDPGFELSYNFFKFSSQIVGNMIRTLSSRLKGMARIKKLLQSIEPVTNVLARNARMLKDSFVVINQENNYNVVRYLYHGGSNYYGPKCVASFGKVAEMRTIEGNEFQVPVVPVKSTDNSVHYQEYFTETGIISKEKLEIGRDDILRRIKDTIEMIAVEGGDIRFIRNYHVYHNTIEWQKTPEGTQTRISNNPTLERITPVEVDLNTPGTSRIQVRTDDISSPSKKARIQQSTSRSFIHQEDMKQTVNLLTKFKENGLTNLLENKELLSLRKVVHSMDFYQTINTVFKPPQDLWFTKKLTRQSIVANLKDQKGKDFYFNDITIITDTKPIEIILKKNPRFTLETEVRYRIKFDSQYGLLDLSAFHSSFKNQYIVSPEVDFFVTDTKFYNGKEILVLEMQQKAMTKKRWLEIKERNHILFEKKVSIPNKRKEMIESAAMFVAENTPLHRLSEMEQAFKNCILNINGENNLVPTYDKVAREIYASNSLPEQYMIFKIDNSNLVDDVLFEKSLVQMNDIDNALNTIFTIYNGIFKQKVEPVFEIYHNSPNIRELLRFEDFYVIYSFTSSTLLLDALSPSRLAIALRRLALRQCSEPLLSSPITIYAISTVTLERFQELIRLKTGSFMRFKNMVRFLSKKENLVNTIELSEPSEIIVMYQLTVSNKAGIADLSSILSEKNGRMYILEEMKFVIIERNKEIIDGRDVFVIKIEDDKLSSETRMIRTVNRINKIFLHGSKLQVSNINSRR